VVSGDECFAPHGHALKPHTQKRLTHETERLITDKQTQAGISSTISSNNTSSGGSSSNSSGSSSMSFKPSEKHRVLKSSNVSE
jgi:hypothetical protein